METLVEVHHVLITIPPPLFEPIVLLPNEFFHHSFMTQLTGKFSQGKLLGAQKKKPRCKHKEKVSKLSQNETIKTKYTGLPVIK